MSKGLHEVIHLKARRTIGIQSSQGRDIESADDGQ